MPQSLHCIVEVPKGSRNKYEWDADWRAMRLDRFLFSSVVYPIDYGFFPRTLATDNDPLDAMIAVSEATFPRCVIGIVHFFSIYKQPGGKHADVDGWYPREDAVGVIRDARERFDGAQTTSS